MAMVKAFSLERIHRAPDKHRSTESRTCCQARNPYYLGAVKYRQTAALGHWTTV
jgi:hypothetical protein